MASPPSMAAKRSASATLFFLYSRTSAPAGAPFSPAVSASVTALPPDTAPDITRRSKIYFLPAGLPLGLCLLLTAVSRTTLPTLTLPLLVPDLFFAALLAAAFVGYRREGAWMQDDHLTLRRQKGFHLHCVCALHPDLCLTVQQSPWAVAAHRANLTLIFPGRLKQKVRSVALTELAFLQQAER